MKEERSLKGFLMILAAMLSTIAFIIFVFIIGSPNRINSPPPFSDMRKYRISQFTDEQIRKFHVDAVRESKTMREKEKEERRKAQEQEEAERTEKEKINWHCESDIAYKERNTSKCEMAETHGAFYTGGPDVLSSVQYPNGQPWDVENLYNEKIMGPCMRVESYQEAKKLKCIDPNY